MNFNQKIAQFKMLVEEALKAERKTIPDLSELVDTTLAEIASTYWRPVSPQGVAEIIMEHLFRDEKSLDIAILDWSIDREENGYDLANASVIDAETCNWGIVADNFFPTPRGWATVSAVRFIDSRKSLEYVLGIAQVAIDSFQADVRIYSLPLDYDEQDGTFRQQFGEVGIPVVSLLKNEEEKDF